jgi:hypothetical protein
MIQRMKVHVRRLHAINLILQSVPLSAKETGSDKLA